jgi:hypothetical protein
MTKPAAKKPTRKRPAKEVSPAPPVLAAEMSISQAVVTEVNTLNQRVAEAIHAAKSTGLPQGFIVAVLQGLTLQQTQMLISVPE